MTGERPTAGLQFDRVVPWGRSFDEYVRFFDLSPDDLRGAVVDCGGGPAGFNAELTRRGGRVVSCDPLYRLPADAIAERVRQTYDEIVRGVENCRERYVWDVIASPAELGRVRMAAMRQFLDDFPGGLAEGRYRPDELPSLPFGDGQFDLALCAHLLFTYSKQCSADFHLACVLEMARVAREVRVFPLLDASGEPSPYVQPVLDRLAAGGYTAEVWTVPYEFQKGGNQMLRLLPRAGLSAR